VSRINKSHGGHNHCPEASIKDIPVYYNSKKNVQWLVFHHLCTLFAPEPYSTRRPPWRRYFFGRIYCRAQRIHDLVRVLSANDFLSGKDMASAELFHDDAPQLVHRSVELVADFRHVHHSICWERASEVSHKFPFCTPHILRCMLSSGCM